MQARIPMWFYLISDLQVLSCAVGTRAVHEQVHLSYHCHATTNGLPNGVLTDALSCTKLYM